MDTREPGGARCRHRPGLSDGGGGDDSGGGDTGGADPGASCPAAPVFDYSRYPFQVDPYSAPGTYIGRVSARDLNGCALTYQRSFGQYADTFNVSSSGVITLAKDWPVPVDTLREYSFRVQADNGTFLGSTTVEVRFPTLEVSPETPRLIDLDDPEGPTEWTYQITNVSTGPLDAFVKLEEAPAWLELREGEDAFPLDLNEWLDTDGDGVGNNADPDDDGDGIPDAFELATDGLDPLDPSDATADFDEDGRTNRDEYQQGGDLFADDVPPEL